MADVIPEDAYANSPEWAQKRFNKFAYKNGELQRQNEALTQRLASLEGRIDAIGTQRSASNGNTPVEDDVPFIQKAKESELHQLAKRLTGLRVLALDPDATPEQRAEAKKQLSAVEDVDSVIFDIQTELVDRRAKRAVGSLQETIETRTALEDQQRKLVTNLFTKFGKDAVDKNSELSKAAFSKLNTWAQEYGMTAEQVSDFMTYKAFEEAASELASKARTPRGADPRQQAVMGGGERPSPSPELLASLRERGKSGDFKAARQANRLELNEYFRELIRSGSVRGPR
jgi:hypothetical protein